MAILFQYLRLFAPTRELNRFMWWGAWFTIIASTIFYTVFMFWTMYYCKPRHMIWNKLAGGSCQDHSPIVITQGAFNMASDIIILLLPTSSLWKLDIPLLRKSLITILFATGLLACIASIMRIVFTTKIAPVYSQSDVSHNGLYIGLWTMAEVSLGFVVACSLSLPRLIQAKRKKFSSALSYISSPFSTNRSGNSKKSSPNNMNSTLKSTRATSRCSDQIQLQPSGKQTPEKSKRPVVQEAIRVANTPETRRPPPIRPQRDPYPLPSSSSDSSGSSQYSHSMRSMSTAGVERGTIVVAPLNWNSKNTLSPYDPSIPSSSREPSRSPNPSSLRNTYIPTTQSNITNEIIDMPPLNGMNAGGERESIGLTYDELYVLAQFSFERFEDSIDIEREADLALKPR
ncbi:hypothetical protein B0J11DRAFT_433972 [Dendryphion nanum]|uniref:Rhodopsin domain-containing protein n=1 Tax=Dendryphion nanum TaxID=256645 RepID=A0A9P9DT21_9PLEO|nr:hypothetical protein B0J11DRAFT_433972 [Dendryphion nanum]